jgi:hypothetical protein
VKRLNEFNAVDALVGIAPWLLGCGYTVSESPDELDSKQKEVDFVLAPKEPMCPKLAVEHTVVEAFPGQRTYLHKSYEIVDRVNLAISAKLPINRFFGLVLPPELVNQLRRKEIDRFVVAISPWVATAAKPLDMTDYAETEYNGHRIFLMCSGSDPKLNGSIGRMPGVPADKQQLARRSLLSAIEHGIGKFPKYRQLGHKTVLVIEDASGAIYPSTLRSLNDDHQSKGCVDEIDYVVEFASYDDRMIVGMVWKEQGTYYDPIPYNRRFHMVEKEWEPFERHPGS